MARRILKVKKAGHFNQSFETRSSHKSAVSSPLRGFSILRTTDLTGVSGTGVVAEGVVFNDGTAELRWVVKAKLADGSMRKINSVTMFADWRDVALLHGHGGASSLVWSDTGEKVSDIDLLRNQETSVA
jgi:hypothetical protein